jgi:acyl carrier protein
MASIEERLTKIISDHLGVDPKTVKPESKLVDDLNADSLDLVELVMAVEDEYELNIPDDEGESFRTVSDVIAYVRKHMSGAED